MTVPWLPYVWNGKDQQGSITADGACTATVLAEGEGKRLEWFPANRELEILEAVHGAWDSASGTLTYTLPKAARVHAQIGYLREDAETKKRDGPVLKTLVNRQPRAAGKTVEAWNGFDEGNAIYLGSSPDLSMSVMAPALPAGSVISSRSRRERRRERSARNRELCTSSGA